MNIFVGNLSYDSSDEDLQTAFAVHGQVESAKVIMDRMTGRSRGFGFVEMPNNQEGQTAIDALNGADLQGRPLTVNQAKPREERGGGGGGYGGPRGY